MFMALKDWGHQWLGTLQGKIDASLQDSSVKEGERKAKLEILTKVTPKSWARLALDMGEVWDILISQKPMK